MFTRKAQIELIIYEATHIKYCNDLEDKLKSIFSTIEYTPDLPSQNFELLYMVLDDLGVPQDSNEHPRDDYNNLFSDLYWSKRINKATVGKFLDAVIDLRDEKANA